MTETGYLIWFIATAIMTILVLAVGTLAAAGMLTREKSREGTPRRSPAPRVDALPQLEAHRTPAGSAPHDHSRRPAA